MQDYRDEQTTIVDIGKYVLLSDAELETLFASHIAKNASIHPITSADDHNRALRAARGFFANGSIELVTHLERDDVWDVYVTLSEPRMLSRAFVPCHCFTREILDEDYWVSMRRAVIVCLLALAYAPTRTALADEMNREADALGYGEPFKTDADVLALLAREIPDVYGLEDDGLGNAPAPDLSIAHLPSAEEQRAAPIVGTVDGAPFALLDGERAAMDTPSGERVLVERIGGTVKAHAIEPEAMPDERSPEFV